MPRRPTLLSQFEPSKYVLRIENDSELSLEIEGRKLKPPSRRITLHQSGLKVTSAKLTAKTKKGELQIPVNRINHIKSFEQVRLHSREMLYPGEYLIRLEFKSNADAGEYQKLSSKNRVELAELAWRQYFPSVDEQTAKSSAQITIID